jgi:ribonuclease HII
MFTSDETIGAVERWCQHHDIRWIVGVDEAGRGPLAGPVYTAAVALDVRAIDGDWLEALDDSKELEPEHRDELFEQIPRRVPACRITSSDRSVIDEINILEATRSAMKEAVASVDTTWEATLDRVFVDGDTRIDIDHRQQTIVEGDGLSYAIAAASILAKVARDRFMIECDERWSAYGFASNKGYPTPDHREALERHGPCPIHRRSFGSVPS